MERITRKHVGRRVRLFFDDVEVETGVVEAVGRPREQAGLIRIREDGSGDTLQMTSWHHRVEVLG